MGHNKALHLVRIDLDRVGSPVNPIVLNIPDDAWRACGDEDPENNRHASDYLRVTVSIAGVDFHMEAIAVLTAGLSVVEAADTRFAEDLDRVYALSAADGPLQPLDINGRPYAVFMTPFSL